MSFLHDFAKNPVDIKISRSTFDRSCRHKTSFSEGKLVPFFVDEVLPGDTFNLRTSTLIRLSNPAVRPVMDDMYLDYYYFFVPSRILWQFYEEVHGQATPASFSGTATEYIVPKEASTGVVEKGSFYDYLGVPPGVSISSLGVSLLPYAAYCKIWNEFFRDENYQTINVTADNVYSASNNSSVFTNGRLTIGLLSVSRYHDYFSSCLPAPQKGAAVSLPLGSTAPVSVSGTLGNTGVQFYPGTTVSNAGVTVTGASGSPTNLLAGGAILDGQTISKPFTATGTADLSNATAANINAIRQAFQLQRLLERDARGGTRYTELLKSHFGVSNGDSRLQRPEFLGGQHLLLNMTQVQQTSSGTGNSAVGSLGAYSCTGNMSGSFVKSFTEFGYVIGVCCVRVKHSYSQGLPRYLTRLRRFDFYYPSFANLGEQPVYQKEIYAATSNLSNVWGFQEAWADYRYKPDLVTGQLRPGSTTDLTAWTFGDNYTTAPTLSGDWLLEGTSNIDQTLRVPAATADQFLADFGVYNKCTRPMPLYSVPGLIDHN